MTRHGSPPARFDPIRASALEALGPVRPADSSTLAERDFLFNAKRTAAGSNLPAYYLLYFLLVDLLGFRNLGRSEKVAWSVPIDYQGKGFLIEHRKLGVGLFAQDPSKDEEAAREIVQRIRDAASVAAPYFEWLAEQAIDASAVNVVNNSKALLDRYEFLLAAFQAKLEEAERRKDERVEVKGGTTSGQEWTSTSFPSDQLRVEANWLAISAIEAFFSWTEHIFIHIAILTGRISSAKEVASLAEASWPDKFTAALDISEPETKQLYDQLLGIRREVRNYVAHGAFGKQGEAFTFHSGAGAVPVLLPHRSGSRSFAFGYRLAFDSEAAVGIIRRFTTLLWTGPIAPAEMYIQESGLPTILTMAADGTYRSAMQSVEAMEQFVDYLSYQFDQAANMDW